MSKFFDAETVFIPVSSRQWVGSLGSPFLSRVTHKRPLKIISLLQNIYMWSKVTINICTFSIWRKVTIEKNHEIPDDMCKTWKTPKYSYEGFLFAVKFLSYLADKSCRDQAAGVYSVQCYRHHAVCWSSRDEYHSE